MKLTETELQRLQDLLADRAVFGLASAEAAELELLQSRAAQTSQLPDAVEYERLSADLLLATTPPLAAPDALVQQLESAAARFFDLPESDSQSAGDHTARSSQVRLELGPSSPAGRRSASGVSGRESLAWIAATALAVLLIVSWISQTALRAPDESGPGEPGRGSARAVATGEPGNGDVPGPDPVPQERPAPTLRQQREQLLASDDAFTLQWLPSSDPAALVASGDVVWSNERQEGYLTFRKLAANDPTMQQYQLWIIDGQRDPAQPVDGGVFDVEATDDEVIVRIDAKLQVFDPQAFAVTIEKPGGVVVSDRSRLPLLASRDAI
ncbi:MAG: anti-sigma factor [Planctomycetaceae bacterium]|nr:anti-sigma factor [Planctomycetaceae bacterium]